MEYKLNEIWWLCKYHNLPNLPRIMELYEKQYNKGTEFCHLETKFYTIYITYIIDV